MIPIAILAAVLSLVVGCTTMTSPGDGPGLAGRTFLSVSVAEGGAERPLVPGTQVRLDFGRDGQLGASAGCNSIGGTYTVEGNRLRVSGGAMTDMGCDEPRHAQDEWLVAFLESAPTVQLSGTDLALTGGGTVIGLQDRTAADPDRPLVGPVWTVTSVREDDMMMAFADGQVAASLQFAPDGRVSVSTGCNTGEGTVTETSDGTLAFGEVALTKRACLRPGADLEAAVMAVLRAEAVAWSIEAGTLTLDAGNRGLVLSAP